MKNTKLSLLGLIILIGVLTVGLAGCVTAPPQPPPRRTVTVRTEAQPATATTPAVPAMTTTYVILPPDYYYGYPSYYGYPGWYAPFGINWRIGVGIGGGHWHRR